MSAHYLSATQPDEIRFVRRLRKNMIIFFFQQFDENKVNASSDDDRM